MQIPQLRAPLVLVHGLFGFAQMRLGPWVALDYFHDFPKALVAAGNRVAAARLHPTGGIAFRAGQLKAFLDATFPTEPVHLFAHSMGGLDARYLISRLDMAPRVLSLTTLGTPHRGSPFADWALTHLVPFVAPVFDYFQLPREAFEDLTVVRCRQFNEETPNAAGVRYYSIAGQGHSLWRNPSWALSAPIVERAEGPNDGIVSVASATWGEGCDVWEGDHMSLINWPQPGAKVADQGRLPQYAAHLRRLHDEGF